MRTARPDGPPGSPVDDGEEVASAPGTPGDAPPAGFRHPWLYRLLVVVLASALCVAVLEAGFRIAGYEPIYAVYSKPEIFWQRDPLLGWSLEPGAAGTYVGPRPFPVAFRADVRINSLGLRGSEVAGRPPPGGRVLVLGDSQAAAFEVDEAQSYAGLAAGRLTERAGRAVEVVNGGVRGYGTDQAYLLYTERLRRLRPDVVVFHASANDPEDDTTLHRMRRPFGKPAFALADDGSLDLVGAPVPDYPFCSLYRLDESYKVQRVDGMRARTLCLVQTRLTDHSAVLSFVTARLQTNPRLIWQLNRLGTSDRQETYIPPPPEEGGPSVEGPSDDAAPPAPPPPGETAQPQVSPPLDSAHRLTSALIRTLARGVREDGASFVLLGNAADLAALDGPAFARDGIAVVLVDDAIGADQTAFRFANDGHLNPAGHDRVAALLADRLDLP
ncbi:MAG TPA: SGNH/GDSL hydrolase family protein [Egibacteraceae bacterium]|nr:SGNH/GDSL hydrolase family protein [Egibacteraceae bacterium]